MTNENLKKALAEFERKLLESQQDLSEEFQKVLNENIWDLYDESDGDILEFAHEGISYKVLKIFDDEKEEYCHIIHRRVPYNEPYDEWIYWCQINDCRTLKEAREKFIDDENNS